VSTGIEVPLSPTARLLGVGEDLPLALTDVGQGTGSGVHGLWHNLPEQAPRAFIQVVVDADGS
jgi:hypothetical protein